MRTSFFLSLFLFFGVSCGKRSDPSKPIKDEKASPFAVNEALEAPAKEPDKLFCDKSNFWDYILDSEKTSRLVAETGEGCQLQGLILTNTILNASDFSFADLTGADLSGSSFIQANFAGAILIDAIFQNAVLQFVNLPGALVQGADFRGADLRGSKANHVNMRHTLYDKHTLFGPMLSPYPFAP